MKAKVSFKTSVKNNQNGAGLNDIIEKENTMSSIFSELGDSLSRESSEFIEDDLPDTIAGYQQTFQEELINPGSAAISKKRQGKIIFPLNGKTKGGGHLLIESRFIPRRERLIVTIPSVSERDKYEPPLAPQESLISDAVIIRTEQRKSLKGTFELQMTFKEVDIRYYSIALRYCSIDGTWTCQPIDEEEAEQKAVTTISDKLGTYALTATLKFETATIPILGLLYNSRLSRYISIRFPKRSIQSPIDLKIQIVPFSRAKFESTRLLFLSVCQDVLFGSDFYDITPLSHSTTTTNDKIGFHQNDGITNNIVDQDNELVEFKTNRPMTIKLPLPKGLITTTNDDERPCFDNIVVIIRTPTMQWDTIKSPLKFTKTTVSFDTKYLGRFWVIKHPPIGTRAMKLSDASAFLSGRSTLTQGDILAFFKLFEKKWVLLIEYVKDELISARKAWSVEADWQRLDEIHVFAEEDKDENPLKSKRSKRSNKIELPERYNWRQKTVFTEKLPDISGVEMQDKDFFLINLKGDIKLIHFGTELQPGDPLLKFVEYPEGQTIKLRYHTIMDNNRVVFSCEPNTDEIRTLISRVRIYRVRETHGEPTCDRIKLLALEIEEDIVAKFWYEPTPPPTPEKPLDIEEMKPLESKESTNESIKREKTSVTRVSTPTNRQTRAEIFKRLTTPHRQATPENKAAGYSSSDDGESYINNLGSKIDLDIEEPINQYNSVHNDNKKSTTQKNIFDNDENGEAAHLIYRRHSTNISIIGAVEPSVKDVSTITPENTKMRKKQLTLFIRASKVLSGRSLQAISQRIPDGLLLGVNLGLSDSAITGIGFDALSNGMGLSDVTYRILLNWKRFSSGDTDTQVMELCTALRNIGHTDIAAVIDLRHREHKEVTKQCLDFISNQTPDRFF